ncbi:MAG: hypothetical protein Q7J16_00840 [Candidatus Cloacimonadales bacterium]|nr:hypothetical protein [Candidatus Cloacimonadales bacterium]
MKLILNWGIKTNMIKYLRKTLIVLDLLQGKKVKTICFYPSKPISYDIMYWICLINKYKVINDLEKPADIYMYWEDDTYHSSELMQKYRGDWVNLDCIDISKSKISSVFQKVFGYDIQIDPLKYDGYCVQKNDLNAKHDGKILKCPIEEINPDSIYQKLINNQKNENLVVDIRVPIFKDFIPFVYLKYRNINHRFLNTNDLAVIKPTHEILNQFEIAKLIKFCNEIRMDYGELDVLRDNEDGQIYVVDANHCPSGPPNHLSFLSKFKSLIKLSKSFDKVFGRV